MKAEATHGHSVAYVLQSAWAVPARKQGTAAPPVSQQTTCVSCGASNEMSANDSLFYITLCDLLCAVSPQHTMYFSVADTLKEIKKK